MKKMYCEFDGKEINFKEVKDKTPQGWPMEILECTGKCGRRILANDPEADYKAANPEKADNQNNEA